MEPWIALSIGFSLILGTGIGFTLCVIVLQKEIRLIRNMRPTQNTVQAKRPF